MATGSTWNDVHPGDWVRGNDGAIWQVGTRQDLAGGGLQFVMERKDRKPFPVTVTKSQAGPEIVRTADAMQDAAIETATSTLGAVMVGVESDGIYACPPEYAEPGVLLAHLHILHGAPVNDPGEEPQTLSVLATLHAAQHKAGGHLPHHHTPDYLGRNRG